MVFTNIYTHTIIRQGISRSRPRAMDPGTITHHAHRELTRTDHARHESESKARTVSETSVCIGDVQKTVHTYTYINEQRGSLRAGDDLRKCLVLSGYMLVCR